MPREHHVQVDACAPSCGSAAPRHARGPAWCRTASDRGVTLHLIERVVREQQYPVRDLGGGGQILVPLIT